MPVTHRYEVTVRWTGNTGSGTVGYGSYSRDHDVGCAGKSSVPGSSDTGFRGDATRWNPEELLVVALAQCHMLWYLHFAAVRVLIVTGYTDTPSGTMEMDAAGCGGQFTEVVLRPVVTVAEASMVGGAEVLHGEIGAVLHRPLGHFSGPPRASGARRGWRVEAMASPIGAGSATAAERHKACRSGAHGLLAASWARIRSMSLR